MTLTPKQFSIVATKQDLEKLATKEELGNVKDEILGAVDHVIKKMDNMEHQFLSNQVAHDRYERRITKVETHLGLNQYTE